MTKQEIREFIMQELPDIVKHDAEIHQFVINLVRGKFADKDETDSRFDRILDELRKQRESQDKEWNAQHEQWQAQNEQWEAQEKKWEDQQKRWEAQEKKWEENQQVIEEILAEIQKLHTRIDHSIGALGARWGIQSEEAFRNGLKAILEQSFGVEVIHVNEWDDSGEVFGRPDQVELDIIIRNGQLIICEIKSSISKADIYIFERKVTYYEKAHQRPCSRKIIISPMIDPRAEKAISHLNIEAYTHSIDVTV
ncbi:DUF3782 domain-containing protein [candidate division KSB3 bacterium]|uniref:DUF3782 domain-containing protein n=1 Tax=candidate division KSB3 bacterium TaxID=2044937 RepID=A0A9D5JSI1_9BACT|nr:DUF3782 domain-containing protein [candidate division KSB3 bacterium]MBD3323393.1 DUF3782 domain-containing protein [candidate division KSB3 bacterium]